MEYKQSNASGVVILASAIMVFVGLFTISRAEDRKADTPDLSTVKSAALAWINASFVGDVAVVHQVLVDDEQQRKFVIGPLRFTSAIKALDEAAVKRFGDSGRQVSGYPATSAKSMEKELEIKEDGDRATAAVAGAMMPLQLRRIDGKWRVDLANAMKDRRVVQGSEASVAAAKAIGEVVAEITDGKYKTADEAKAAFRKRMSQVNN